MATTYWRSEYGGAYKSTTGKPTFMGLTSDGGTKITKAEFIAARTDALREVVSEGDTIHTLRMHTSRNGMSRRFRVYVIRNDTPSSITRMVAEALGYRYHDNDRTIMIGGSGYNQARAIVDDIAQSLFGDPRKLEQSSL